MDRIRVAQELVRLAKELVGGSKVAATESKPFGVITIQPYGGIQYTVSLGKDMPPIEGAKSWKGTSIVEFKKALNSVISIVKKTGVDMNNVSVMA